MDISAMYFKWERPQLMMAGTQAAAGRAGVAQQ